MDQTQLRKQNFENLCKRSRLTVIIMVGDQELSNKVDGSPTSGSPKRVSQ